MSSCPHHPSSDRTDGGGGFFDPNRPNLNPNFLNCTSIYSIKKTQPTNWVNWVIIELIGVQGYN